MFYHEGDDLPDFIEMQEDRIERIMDERSLPNGMYRCGCGKVVRLEDTLAASSNPWAEPICEDCFGESLTPEQREEWNNGTV